MMWTMVIAAQVFGAAGLTELVSVEDLCAAHPDRVDRLLAALDVDRPGLEAVARALEAGDKPAACRALLAYYHEGPTAPWWRASAPQPGDGRDAAADTILDDTFSFYQVTARVPRRPDGGLDWAYNGPENDLEWGWGLNRQFWLMTLLRAYRGTGNPVYAKALNDLLQDWVRANPYPGAKTRSPQWRGLETRARIEGPWPSVFYGLQDAAELTPATRLLILSSVPDHAHYARHFHRDEGNWLAMEMYGLATAATSWPEFRDADDWFAYAFETILPEVGIQVYPDGVQKELTSHYHRVTMNSFNRFVRVADQAGRPMPEAFRAGIERMYHYVAYTMRPSGYGPLNNDSNLDYTRPDANAGAEAFGREDWRYIASNGTEGRAPEDPPSAVFPWAGQVIMRSGWDADAHWSFFDVGPLGIGHWHFDKLHLSVAAHGRDILVDAGRYTYVGGPWRQYFVGSASHNVILVDGNGQQANEREARRPMTDNYLLAPEFDFARGTFDSGFTNVEGRAVHTRAVVYVRGKYWVVVDRFETDRPRALQPLWHFHPACAVAAEGASVVSTDPDLGNARITPVGGPEWSVDLVKGREEPDIQGWWSVEYGIKEPSVCAVYSGRIEKTAVFAWVIVPGRGTVAPLGPATALVEEPDRARVTVHLDGAPTQTVVVPWSGTAAEVAEGA